jgi:hypothetical protein
LHVKQHLEKADRNRDFIKKHLFSFLENYPDWVSIVSFYCALHYVDALLATHGLHWIHHEERNRDVSLLMPEIQNEYLNLYDLGRNSRYGDLEDMPSVDEAKQAANIDLLKIEEFVKSRLHG